MGEGRWERLVRVSGRGKVGVIGEGGWGKGEE